MSLHKSTYAKDSFSVGERLRRHSCFFLLEGHRTAACVANEKALCFGYGKASIQKPYRSGDRVVEFGWCFDLLILVLRFPAG
jgi:hypothetical protein